MRCHDMRFTAARGSLRPAMSSRRSQCRWWSRAVSPPGPPEYPPGAWLSPPCAPGSVRQLPRPARAEGAGSSSQPPQQPDGQGSRTPDLTTGINWFCYSAIGLLFLTDFTPLGAAVESSDSPGVALAALQWGAFVLPTLWFARQRGFSFPETFKLRSSPPALLAAAAAAGPALFLLLDSLVRIRLGISQDAGAAAAAAALSAGGGGPGWGAAGQSPAALLALYVLSPAVAEELLFRGFLLTALQSRLGRVDSLSLAAALFALMHLSVEQFFQYCVLGLACGAAAVAADSLLPPVLLHAGYNLAAVALAAGVGNS